MVISNGVISRLLIYDEQCQTTGKVGRSRRPVQVHLNLLMLSVHCLLRTPSGALDALKIVHFLRRQKRGRGTGPEKGLFGKTAPMKSINFHDTLEDGVSSKSQTLIGIYTSHLIVYRKPT